MRRFRGDGDRITEATLTARPPTHTLNCHLGMVGQQILLCMFTTIIILKMTCVFMYMISSTNNKPH